METPDEPVRVQSRISVFEALAATKPMNPTATKSAPSLLDTPLSPSSKSYFPISPSPPAGSSKFSSRSPSASPPALGRKTSLIDLKDWVLEDGPLPYAPRQKKVPGAKPIVNGKGAAQRHAVSAQSTPLIHLESSPPRAMRSAPPLPPRKASYGSLKSISMSNSSTSSLARSPNAPPIPLPTLSNRKKSDSLTVDHTYPPLGKLGIAIPPRGSNGSGHVPASSISSFHSVSLSSDGGTDQTTPGSLSNFVTTYPVDRDDRDADFGHEHDTISLDESFENVSTSSMMSPSASSVSTDWAEFTRRDPPKLPQRPASQTGSPSSLHSPSSTATISVSYAVRPQTKQPPPPPPPRNRIPSSNRSSFASTTASSSDHSSVLSTPTSRSSLSSGRPAYPPKYPSSAAQAGQLARPPPVPPSARLRYEKVFNTNIVAQRKASKEIERTLSPPPGRKARQAAGWRGLSVDLITNPDEHPKALALAAVGADEDVGADERLDGRIVAMIWRTSRLERAKLQSIWRDCDAAGRGSLDRDAFVKGMWRIDEELRKAQLHAHSPSTSRPPKGLVSLLR